MSTDPITARNISSWMCGWGLSGQLIHFMFSLEILYLSWIQGNSGTIRPPGGVTKSGPRLFWFLPSPWLEENGRWKGVAMAVVWPPEHIPSAPVPRRHLCLWSLNWSFSSGDADNCIQWKPIVHWRLEKFTDELSQIFYTGLWPTLINPWRCNQGIHSG